MVQMVIGHGDNDGDNGLIVVMAIPEKHMVQMVIGHGDDGGDNGYSGDGGDDDSCDGDT